MGLLIILAWITLVVAFWLNIISAAAWIAITLYEKIINIRSKVRARSTVV